jgi:WYL_2, Sm-like SH3 beta-barrel fold
MKMSEKKFEFKTKKEKDWLLGLLRSEIVELTFTKKDGTERIMKCTLAEQKIPAENAPKGVERTKSDEAVAVFDLENNGWRSFRWDSLTEINFTLGSLQNA